MAVNFFVLTQWLFCYCVVFYLQNVINFRWWFVTHEIQLWVTFLLTWCMTCCLQLVVVVFLLEVEMSWFTKYICTLLRYLFMWNLSPDEVANGTPVWQLLFCDRGLQTDFDCCLSVMQLVDGIVRQSALEAVCLLLRLSTDTQVPGAALP